MSQNVTYIHFYFEHLITRVGISCGNGTMPFLSMFQVMWVDQHFSYFSVGRILWTSKMFNCRLLWSMEMNYPLTDVLNENVQCPFYTFLVWNKGLLCFVFSFWPFMTSKDQHISCNRVMHIVHVFYMLLKGRGQLSMNCWRFGN